MEINIVVEESKCDGGFNGEDESCTMEVEQRTGPSDCHLGEEVNTVVEETMMVESVHSPKINVKQVFTLGFLRSFSGSKDRHGHGINLEMDLAQTLSKNLNGKGFLSLNHSGLGRQPAFVPKLLQNEKKKKKKKKKKKVWLEEFTSFARLHGHKVTTVSKHISKSIIFRPTAAAIARSDLSEGVSSLSNLPLNEAKATIQLGFLLNCGSDNELQEGGLKYITDDGFITVGNKTTLKQPGLHLVLSTLRYFPDNAAHKYCYVFPVIKGGKFLVKTTYYYGGYDGEKEPPVFDQFIDGTKWSMVNTTEDYANGLSSFYEIIVTAHGKTLSVCLARNQHTVSSPFISALELQHLEDSLYNSTDFDNYALSTVARNCFGCEAQIISFPDDQFNRFWTPFKDSNPVVTSRSNITASEFWNIPPAKALSAAITTSRGKKLTVKWPPFLLPKTNYYIALYFQDNRNPSPYSWRVFSVAVNGMDFYTDINVTTKGVSVYTAHWPLAGQTEIVLTPHSDSPVGPLINAGEVFQIFPLGKRTLTRDVIAIEDLARGFDNPPGDWHGDPCLPEKHSWTGVTCSIGAKYARIVSLNLTNVGLIGELAESVDHLTALTSLTLEGNKLSGSIPKMSSLKSLEILHLDGNQFQGEIPESLGQLTHLRSLQLQNNYLNGSVPNSLLKKNGLNLHIDYGYSVAGQEVGQGNSQNVAFEGQTSSPPTDPRKALLLDTQQTIGSMSSHENQMVVDDLLALFK
ncbi:hypothetical protein TEA_022429 [Camellia sinensis var. sinensis]|uniref:Malectin-like domain-containing protein n=1 Tax=Camellia sinensis var. sinensis TaxID=542762 RepID=A0A4S4DI31_CAMSN|nr:hypothetical protein TEA_022429 [Camellia sinensis var. sinensis]